MKTQSTNSQRPTVLITGAALRLGKAMAEAFFARDCNLMLHYRQSGEAAESLAHHFNQIRAGSCHLVQANLSRPYASKTIIESTIKHFGRLDHVVNNASIFYPTPFESMSENELLSIIQTNALAPISLIKQALSYLKQSNGSVVNLIDIYAQSGLKNHTAYVAAKSALEAATFQLAYELAPEVRINGVSPGAILWPDNETTSDQEKARQQILENTALKRLGEPEDIAATVIYLTLDASYTTGSVIKVDGGRRWYL